MKTRGLVLLYCVTMLFACNNKSKTNLEISGTISNLDKITQNFPGAGSPEAVNLFLYEIPVGQNQSPILLDSTTVTANNPRFSLKGIVSKTGMYDISVNHLDGPGPVIPLVNDVTSMTVNIDFAKREKYYSIVGSKASEELQGFIYAYIEKGQQINRAMESIDSLKKLNAPDSVIIESTNFKNQTIDNLNLYLKQFITTSKQPVVASFALGRASGTLPILEFESQMDELIKKFPNDPYVTDIKTQYDAQKRQNAELEKSRNSNEGNWVGKKAPDLTMPDPNGKNLSISSFKGKYVLVDFWASWCGPCRNENPYVVAAYNEFKNKNFTILGVSLDKDKESWKQAIEEDGLAWSHMSDLAYWSSAAVPTFHFDGIPFNVLIDPQGVIIAQSLRGPALTEKLKEVLK